ncbi:hypothetical protein Avbf_05699, partial [Armadillidium vulgare]
MDMKCEEEIKVELEESTEEDDKKINIHLEQLLTEEIQERNCYESIDMKSEIEVKEEPLHIDEEKMANDELWDKIFQLDPNQVLIKCCFKI